MVGEKFIKAPPANTTFNVCCLVQELSLYLLYKQSYSYFPHFASVENGSSFKAAPLPFLALSHCVVVRSETVRLASLCIGLQKVGGQQTGMLRHCRQYQLV